MANSLPKREQKKRKQTNRIIRKYAISKEEYERLTKQTFDPEIDEIAQDTPDMNTPMNV